MPHNSVRRIRMNLELGGERPNRRKRLAWLEFAADESLLGSKHKLVKYGFARVQAKPE